MVKFKSLLGIASIFLFGFGALYFYNFSESIYHGNFIVENPEYATHAYFFGWIGYALAAASLLIALYCIYYFLSTLLAIIKKSKY